MKDYFTPEMLNTLFTLVVIPVLGLVSKSVILLLKRKILDLEQSIKNETLNKFLGLSENAIESAVIAVNQTFVEASKKQGTFDDAAMAQAFQLAKTKAISIMGEAAREALNMAFGDMDAWIETKIEYFVNRNKQL